MRVLPSDAEPRVSRRIGVAATLGLLLLGGAELGARWREGPTSGAFEPLLGVRGYRGGSFQRERSDRGVRIVVVGDDQAWGSGLPAEHAWPALLQGLFAHDGRASAVEVINAAEPGASAARVREVVSMHVLNTQPSWLVIALGESDVRRVLRSTSERPWWLASALVRALATQPPARGLEYDAARELERRVRFDFGVELARIVESAWERRCYVAIVLSPWPSATSASPATPAGEVDPGELARRIHASLCEEAAFVAQVQDVALIDARSAVDARHFDGRGQLDLSGAQAMARAIYGELRVRIP